MISAATDRPATVTAGLRVDQGTVEVVAFDGEGTAAEVIGGRRARRARSSHDSGGASTMDQRPARVAPRWPMHGKGLHVQLPGRRLAAAHRAAVGASMRWPGGDGAAGERGASKLPGAPAASGGHPAVGLDTPWGSFCADAVGRTTRLLAYPTGHHGRGAARLLLKFPPGGSATLVPGRDSLGALIEVADFASWWRS